VLEQQKPPLRHYDITPSNIVIDAARGRAILTGFQVPPPPIPQHPNMRSERFRKRTTRKLVISHANDLVKQFPDLNLFIAKDIDDLTRWTISTARALKKT
jgi:hypothetical protein